MFVLEYLEDKGRKLCSVASSHSLSYSPSLLLSANFNYFTDLLWDWCWISADYLRASYNIMFGNYSAVLVFSLCFGYLRAAPIHAQGLLSLVMLLVVLGMESGTPVLTACVPSCSVCECMGGVRVCCAV